MKKKYTIMNIKCGGCASSIESVLKERFPDITVDLTTEPRVVSATVLSLADEKYLLDTLSKHGYPLETVQMSALSKKYLYGKSYISCMHGKIKSKKI